MKKRRILRSERGFTLVELGIVMAIIAILAAVAYPTYTGIKKRAYIAEAKATLQEIRVEVYAVWVEAGEWPTSTSLTTPTGSDNWSFTLDSTAGGTTNEYYLITAEGKGTNVANHKVVLRLDQNGKAKFWDGAKSEEPSFD